MVPKNIACAILLTQDIRENSYDGNGYLVDEYQSAEIAVKVLKLDPSLSHFVGLNCSAIWNDCQMWALEQIKGSPLASYDEAKTIWIKDWSKVIQKFHELPEFVKDCIIYDTAGEFLNYQVLLEWIKSN